MISENLRFVQQEITNSCALVSRLETDVQLIAVTKSVGISEMTELLQTGVTNFAENRVDIFLEKKSFFSKNNTIVWHYIGNLQRRKVKSVINEIDYFHALDSLKLAQEIDKRAEKTIKCFIEVNVSGEESKHGIDPSELMAFIKSLQGLSKVQVVGLMTMAPYESSKEEQRILFRRLKQLQEVVYNLQLPYAPCHELSMGMSNDYTVAITEGATFVRVGRALFLK